MLIGSDAHFLMNPGVNTIRDHVENYKQDTEMIMRTYMPLLGEVRASCGMRIINQVLLSRE